MINSCFGLQSINSHLNKMAIAFFKINHSQFHYSKSPQKKEAALAAPSGEGTFKPHIYFIFGATHVRNTTQANNKAPMEKTVSPGTRIQTNKSMIGLPINSAERAYQ